MDRNDAWMLKACQDLCFFHRIRGVNESELWVDDLDCDVSVQTSVARRVDYSHASAPELFTQLVWRAGQIRQFRDPTKMIQRAV
jgi:hypothetical protein